MRDVAVLSPRARRDLLNATLWIKRDNPPAARALRQAVAAAAKLIGEHPLAGRTRSELANSSFRFVALTGFPYVIVYDAESRPPVIIRVLHGARDLPEAMRDS